MSVGSRTVNVGAGLVWFPNASRLTAMSRIESVPARSRGFCGESVIEVTGPGTPVVENLTWELTPVTDAVTSLGPRMVPSVQDAVASPLSSVFATRGFVEPLPCVTANATAAFVTGEPSASVTFTTSAFGSDDPTAAVAETLLPASSRAGTFFGETESLPHAPAAATIAAALRTAAPRRRTRRRVIDVETNTEARQSVPYPGDA